MSTNLSKNPIPFTCSYPEQLHVSPTEAELSEGATQPPTDRPPPSDPPADLSSETNATPLADTSTRVDHESNKDDQQDAVVKLPSISLRDSESDVNKAISRRRLESGTSIWPTSVTRMMHSPHSAAHIEQILTIGMDEIIHQNLVLYGIRAQGCNITIKKIDTLNDGHPIPETVLYAHAKWTKALSRKESGLYYRGDFIDTRKECSSGRPIDVTKNTTPFRRFLPSDIDSSTSDMECAWARYYGERDILWHRRWNNIDKLPTISMVNVTVPLLLAVLFRSSFISIRFSHFTGLQHLKSSQCSDCSPYCKYVLQTMACLQECHKEICLTLTKLKRKDRNMFEMTMDDMCKDVSQYLVYHCDTDRQLCYQHIEFPHLVEIKLHLKSETITLATLYMQVPPYYFAIPVSLCNDAISTPTDYKDLIASREYGLISKYFSVIIEKANEKFSTERDMFFKHRPDLRSYDRLLMIYPYRFDQSTKPPKPNCACRHLTINIYDQDIV